MLERLWLFGLDGASLRVATCIILAISTRKMLVRSWPSTRQTSSSVLLMAVEHVGAVEMKARHVQELTKIRYVLVTLRFFSIHDVGLDERDRPESVVNPPVESSHPVRGQVTADTRAPRWRRSGLD